MLSPQQLRKLAGGCACHVERLGVALLCAVWVGKRQLDGRQKEPFAHVLAAVTRIAKYAALKDLGAVLAQFWERSMEVELMGTLSGRAEGSAAAKKSSKALVRALDADCVLGLRCWRPVLG